MTAKTIMVMGTGSSAGKSLLTTAICRCLARRGVRVAPFKGQNMSNNASVCAGGGEIGRSQALQAIAAGVSPTTDMNPVLLKPEGQTRSQVIVNGSAMQTLEATDYFKRRQQLWPHVTAALDRLRREYDVVVIEGAGSPAELNLADVEMVNLSIARYCRSPVILVGDIERGGVFAQLLGTLWLMEPDDRELVHGLIVNKFRGDLSLFDSGVEILQQRGGVPVLGVLPWIEGLELPEEDAVALDDADRRDGGKQSHVDDLDIAVIRLPHIANFDDFDPLASHDGAGLRYVSSVADWGNPSVVILPGTKNTCGDLQWLHTSGLAARVQAFANSGGDVVGICGGYQMLGTRIENPLGLETDAGVVEGLGLLPTITKFQNEKQTVQVRRRMTDDTIAPGITGTSLVGYEIHNGVTTTDSPWLEVNEQAANGQAAKEHREFKIGGDGCWSRGGRVWGCYLHGLFANDEFRAAWLKRLGVSTIAQRSSEQRLQDSLDRLADHFEKHINMEFLYA